MASRYKKDARVGMYLYIYIYNWLVVSNMILIFHNIWDVILPIDFHIFSEGLVYHQPDNIYIYIYLLIMLYTYVRYNI